MIGKLLKIHNITPLSNTPAGKDICSGFVEDSFCNGQVC